MKKIILILFIFCFSINAKSQYIGGIADGFSSAKITNIPTNDTISISINLNSGWNLISSNVIPTVPNMANVFQNISSLVLVKNSSVAIYNPIFGINQIGNWNIAEGYQVYVSSPAILEIVGNAVIPEFTQIYLNAGWNLISYLRNNDMLISLALQSIEDELIFAKDGLGNIYHPTFGINNIGDMQQGKGYWLYMSLPVIFIYPEN